MWLWLGKSMAASVITWLLKKNRWQNWWVLGTTTFLIGKGRTWRFCQTKRLPQWAGKHGTDKFGDQCCVTTDCIGSIRFPRNVQLKDLPPEMLRTEDIRKNLIVKPFHCKPCKYEQNLQRSLYIASGFIVWKGLFCLVLFCFLNKVQKNRPKPENLAFLLQRRGDFSKCHHLLWRLWLQYHLAWSLPCSLKAPYESWGYWVCLQVYHLHIFNIKKVSLKETLEKQFFKLFDMSKNTEMKVFFSDRKNNYV